MPEPSSVVTQLSNFFNHLVELIPARLYRSEPDESRVSLANLNKADRLAAQQELRAKGKLNKRAKLAGAQQGGGAAEPPSGDDGAPPAAASSGQHAPLLNIPTESVARTELQERLQQRLQAMQQQRQQKDKPQSQGVNKRQAAKQAKDWKQKQLESSVKAKQQQQDKPQGKQQQQGAGQKRKPEGDASAGAAKKQQGQAQGQQQQGGASFAFPRIELDDGRPGAGNKHGKKPSKEVLLKIAEAKQKEKQEAGEDAKPKVTHEAWKSAMMRASGEKVLDDPKLLRKSLKKEQKRKEKSAKGWQERTQKQQEQVQARQTKRKENLQARSQGRVDKKKSKREKKLLKAGGGGGAGAGAGAGAGSGAEAAKKAPRAGFEGRRSTFIGGGKK